MPVGLQKFSLLRAVFSWSDAANQPLTCVLFLSYFTRGILLLVLKRFPSLLSEIEGLESNLQSLLGSFESQSDHMMEYVPIISSR